MSIFSCYFLCTMNCSCVESTPLAKMGWILIGRREKERQSNNSHWNPLLHIPKAGKAGLLWWTLLPRKTNIRKYQHRESVAYSNHIQNHQIINRNLIHNLSNNGGCGFGDFYEINKTAILCLLFESSWEEEGMLNGNHSLQKQSAQTF